MGKNKKKRKQQQQQQNPGQNVSWFKANNSGTQGITTSGGLINPWESGLNSTVDENFQEASANSYMTNSSRSVGSSYDVSHSTNQTFNQGYTSMNSNANYPLANERNRLMNDSFNQGYERPSNSSGYKPDTLSSRYQSIGSSYEGKRPMNDSLNQEYKRAKKSSGYEYVSSPSNFNSFEPSKDGKASLNQSFNQGYTSTNASKSDSTSRSYGFGSTNEAKNQIQSVNQGLGNNAVRPMNQAVNQAPGSNAMRPINQSINQGPNNDMVRAMNQLASQVPVTILQAMNMIRPIIQPLGQGSTNNMMSPMNQPVNKGSTNMLSKNQSGNQGSANMISSMNQPTSQGPTNDNMMQSVNQRSINNGMYTMNPAISQGPTNNNMCPTNQSVNQGPVKMMHSINQVSPRATSNVMNQVGQGPTSNIMNRLGPGPTNNMMNQMNQVGQGSTSNMMNQLGQGASNNIMNRLGPGPTNNMMNQVCQGSTSNMMNQMNQLGQGASNNMMYQVGLGPSNNMMNQVSQGPTNMMHPMNQQFNYGQSTLNNSNATEYRGVSNFNSGNTGVPPSKKFPRGAGIPSLMDANFSSNARSRALRTQRSGGSMWENQYRLHDYRTYDLNRVTERVQPKSLVARLQQRTLLSRLKERNRLTRQQQRSFPKKPQLQLPKKRKRRKKSKATAEAKGKSDLGNKSEKKIASKPDRASEPAKEGKENKNASVSQQKKEVKENKNASVSQQKKEIKENKNAPVTTTSVKKQKEEKEMIIYPGSAFHCPYCEFSNFHSAVKFKKHLTLFYHKQIAEAYFAKMAAGEEYLKASARLYELRNRRQRLDPEGKLIDKRLDSVEQKVYERAIQYPRCCGRKFSNRRIYDEHIGSVEHFKVAYRRSLESEAKLKEEEKTLKLEGKEQPLDHEKKEEVQVNSKTENTEESAEVKDPSEEVMRVISLLKEARKNAEETPLNEDTIPIFEPSKSIGLEFIKESLNFHCTVCQTQVPDLEHCNSVGHYERIIDRLNKMKESTEEETTNAGKGALKETADGKEVFMDDTVKVVVLDDTVNEVFLDDAVEPDERAAPSPITLSSSPEPMDSTEVGQNDGAEKPPSSEIQADSQCFTLDEEEFPDYKGLVDDEFILEKASDLDE